MQPKHLKLTSPKHIRRLLSKIINEIILGSIKPPAANSIAHLCTVLLKTQEMSYFEERLNKLEKALDMEDKTPKRVTSELRKQITELRSSQ